MSGRQPHTRQARERRRPERRAARRHQGRRQPPGPSLLSRLFWLSLTAAVWGMVALAGVVAWYAYDLPDIASLDQASVRDPVVRVEAADGTVLARHGDLYGKPVEVRALPPHLPRAFLAIEDRRFYEHPGIDIVGVLRALGRNLVAGEVREGGSTITQQIAKNLFLTRERTIRRKIQETLLAIWLEQRFTKDQLLSIYLNRIYFGAGAHGVDAASRRYFGKPAEKVTLFEAAVLAGLVRAPSRDNPIADPVRAAQRANVVLAAMARSGWVDERIAQSVRRDRVQVHAQQRQPGSTRYFTDWVFDQVGDFIGYRQGDLIIRTTLDPRLQHLAEAVLVETLEANAERRVGQGALVALSPGGAVRAMVGGRSYAESQYNRATQAQRQPGSAFKLFVYLAALEAGMRPDDLVLDIPVTVEGWTPRNVGGVHRGMVTFREGVARSSNVVAVALAERSGRREVIAAARRLGITAPLRPDPSLALGAHEVTLLELTSAYAAVANGGFGVWPYGIEEIRDGSGEVLYRREGGGPGRVVAENHVASLNDLLTAVVAWGTGKAAALDRPVAGKTGTSQGSRDAWFVGYTADLVTGVWLGNDAATPMDGGGGALAAPLWRDFMRNAMAGTPPRPLPGAVARSQ